MRWPVAMTMGRILRAETLRVPLQYGLNYRRRTGFGAAVGAGDVFFEATFAFGAIQDAEVDRVGGLGFGPALHDVGGVVIAGQLDGLVAVVLERVDLVE